MIDKLVNHGLSWLIMASDGPPIQLVDQIANGSTVAALLGIHSLDPKQ